MDTFPDDFQEDGDFDAPLSYDDAIPYEDQLPTNGAGQVIGGLASRIGTNKLYLLSESGLTGGTARSAKGKRKRGDEMEEVEDADLEEDVNMDGTTIVYRPNALLLKGTPISHVPTSRIFAYATHFDTTLIGVEWIDDETCVLVYSNKLLSKAAHRALQKSAAEEPDEEGYVTAQPIPVTLWPPEERIHRSLGKGDGLKGEIRMRWAREDDVKKRGAKKESQFYKKHGEGAGKEIYSAFADETSTEIMEVSRGRKRRRRDAIEELDAEEKKRLLDAELDSFLADEQDQPEDVDVESPTSTSRIRQSKRMRPEDALYDRLALRSPSPTGLSKMRSDYIDDALPSKMRSDYIDTDGRSLLQRTSAMRAHSPERAPEFERNRPERVMRPLPRRRGRRDEGGGERVKARVQKTQKELDDELDAFLNDRT